MHWSKDFVEHLRTVHLALIATAAALIIVAFTTKPYSTQVAKNELHKIQELRADWSPKLIRSMNRVYADAKGPDADYIVPHGFQGRRASLSLDQDFCGNLTEPVPGKAYHPLLFKLLSDSSLAVLNPRHDYGGHKNDDDDEEVLTGTLAELNQAVPDTLSAFRIWWDKLDSVGLRLYFPVSLDPTARMLFTNEKRPILEQISDHSLNSCTVAATFGAPVEFLETSLSFDLSAPKTPLYFSAYKKEDLANHFFVVSDRYFYVDVDNRTVSSFLAVKGSSFDHSFDDLRRVAEVNGVSNFAKLDEILSKSEASDTPVFEAFGIKFPADVATLGGVAVLLSVQLYFFIYLRKLDGSLKQDDPGWDVPWIGMDFSGLAQSIFFITVVVSPTLSLLILGAEASVRFTRGYWDVANGSVHVASLFGWHWTVLVKIAALSLALASSVVAGVASWTYRPRLLASDSSFDESWED